MADLDLEAIERRDVAHAALGIWVAPRSAEADRRSLLAEVKRLRADREKAREALGRYLDLTDMERDARDEVLRELRAALAEPPAGGP